MFKLGKKIQTLVTYSNDVIYVLFRGEGSGKGNSKDHRLCQESGAVAQCESEDVMGVEITTHFSFSQHVQRLVTASAQTIYALRVGHYIH